MSEFNWEPAPGFTVTESSRVREAQFGDGYSQSYPEGINSGVFKYSLRFNGTHEEIEEILSFLRSKRGSQEFTFTPPFTSTEVKVVCKEWSRDMQDKWHSTLSCEFLRVYR